MDKKLHFSERRSKFLMQHIVYLTIYKYIINTLFQYHDYNDIEAKVMKFHWPAYRLPEVC